MRSAVLLFAFFAATTLHAQNDPTPEQLAQRTVQRYAMVLSLSTAQQEAALSIFTTEETAEAPIRRSERLAREVLDTAIKAADTATIDTTAALLGQLSGQNTLAASLAKEQFYATLSADQQARLNQMEAQSQSMDGSGSGAMGSGRMGGSPPQLPR